MACTQNSFHSVYIMHNKEYLEFELFNYKGFQKRLRVFADFSHSKAAVVPKNPQMMGFTLILVSLFSK